MLAAIHPSASVVHPVGPVPAFQFYPGGRWHLTQHAPVGTDCPNEYRAIRIETDRLIELDHPSDSHHLVLRMELRQQDQGGRNTAVLWRQTFDTVGEDGRLAGFLAQTSEQVLGRLAAEACRPCCADQGAQRAARLIRHLVTSRTRAARARKNRQAPSRQGCSHTGLSS